MSLNNMHAVLEALIKRKTGFTRTPKFGIQADEGDWKARKYRSPGSSSLLAEILLAAYFLAAIVFAVKYRYWIGVPFLLIFFNGFAYTAIFSLVSRPRRPPAPAGFTPRVELEGIGE
jgi:hypothetical protein